MQPALHPAPKVPELVAGGLAPAVPMQGSLPAPRCKVQLGAGDSSCT